MIEDTPRTDAYFKSWQDSWSSAPITLDLCKELEREPIGIASKYDRLNESIPKNKRLFANEFAKEIIASQTKRIKQLEDELIELKHSIRKNKL